MNSASRLLPAESTGRAHGLGRWPGAFGPRFFLALIAGLVWLGPAWWDLRFGYVVLGGDAVALVIWLMANPPPR